MASSSGDDEFVILLCTNYNPNEANIARDREIFISTEDIQCWDFDTILRYQTVRLQANRIRLAEHSSYFRGLLSGSFSESSLDCIKVQWNLEMFMNTLKCIYGCPLDVTSNNFLPLFEGALYFGVDMLLSKCRAWFSTVSLSKNPRSQQILLDDLIHIWNFSLAHAIDFVPALCVSYLARNFMWAMSTNFFGAIPYNLLLDCVKHPCLTVDSEMHLSDALLIWLDANTEQLNCLSRTEDDLTEILKEIRISILPLWFAAADESIDSILRLVKTPSTGSINVLGDFDLKHLRIRLTEYSERVNLSGCPQITSAILLLSLLHPSHSMDPASRKVIKQSLINLECLDKGRISLSLPPTLSFEAVQEVNISKCPRIHLKAVIECFSKSFPSLRTIKAAYLLNFKTITFCKLVQKCPLVCEVDLTVDPSPVIPTQISVVSSSPSLVPPVSNKSFIVGDNSLDMTSVYHSRPSLSNITKLTLEGRSDICDSDLEFISKHCVSLSYLNLKGCSSVTDNSISNLILRCIKLNSILVCDTSFGMNSIQALCSGISKFGNSSASHFGDGHLDSLASSLQTLHMGCCKGVDETSLLELMSQAKLLKSLSLRGTHLVDDALYNFSGSSLEMLDVSNTMTSGPALAHIVRGNSGLKFLNARGCKNLFQQERDTRGVELSFPYSCEELFTDLGRTCKLEEFALGWGFSYFALEALKPAFMSLKSITVGLGGSLGENALRLLPTTCPMLESVNLHFQVISDSIMISIMASLRKLEALALCYCLGDISISSFKLPLLNLKKLRLERVAPWMTNHDLVLLTQNCANLVELSLIGCTHLNSDSQLIISQGWPGLTSIHLEDCGGITSKGITSLFNCMALEDLLLRHNGPGLQRNFILDAASKMPMLRQVSLDLCDASDGDFDIPDYADRYFLSTVKIARCKSKRCMLDLNCTQGRRQAVHEETLVLVWNSKNLTRTVVKERL
ncbi:hypothetical protein EZV62_016139 [Acer yangbiense]|uniref:BTB domain-containing protein n=1 Tax=Acer yangbiense TaxID=1000413 RepID=A0A5C7HMP5_9ROSI|nr:hypothetical protein EZV62_016139 [Acer yangbiense]